MPAPLAKGAYDSPSSPSPSPPSPPSIPPLTPPGLIIAASVLVAAGIAIYESPQVREWVDQSRRKIALALHSLHDELQPRRPSESEGEFDARQERVRRKRNELVKRARDEGVAVDLDELVRIGREEAESGQRGAWGRADRSKSFDELVGADGALKVGGVASGAETSAGVRKRGGGGGGGSGGASAGFAAGALAGAAAVANPFDDDNMLFDVGDGEDTFVSTAASTATPTPAGDAAEADMETETDKEPDSTTHTSPAPLAATTPLVDLTPDADPHSHALSPFEPPTTTATALDFDADFHSSGTLTPPSASSRRSSQRAFSIASDAFSSTDLAAFSCADSDAFSTHAHGNDTDGFSDGGFTDAFSEGGFSDVGAGAMTPSSWTDVGSEEGSEWGGNGGGGGEVQV